MSHIIFHIDVNSAYLSWTAVEQLKNGADVDIRTIPAIIGGDRESRHGIVLAKSPSAKKFGIRTGEPVVNAFRKCPNLHMDPPNHRMYREYSRRLMDFLKTYTPEIEQVSVDECYMDFTGIAQRFSSPVEAAYEIKARVYEKFGFTVNVGISTNKLLAKMASDFEKPDKIHTLYEEEIPNKMWTLPVSDLYMVGRRSLPKLEKMGVKTIGDLARTDQNTLIKKFGKFGKMIWEYANGIDNNPVTVNNDKPKGIGNSVTLPQDVANIEKLEETLLALTEQVSYRLRKQELLANVVNVQIKTNDFKTFSHQRKLDEPTDSTKYLYKEAKKLLETLYQNSMNKQIRLIGVRVDNLEEKEQMQISLFNQIDTEKEKQRKVDKAVDAIKEKFGYEMITRAGKMKVGKLLRTDKE